MNASLLILEIAVVCSGLGLLLLDLWTPAARKRDLGYVAAGLLACILLGSFSLSPAVALSPDGSFALDALSLFFKRFFLVAAIFVIVMSIDFSDRIPFGIAEYYSLILFALAGMMVAASANDFILMFVALELITVTFYILTSFQRGKVKSLEGGVKYLILGALSTAFTVYGIALIFGTAGTTNFPQILAKSAELAGKPLFVLGLLMVMFGLAFKIAAFPFQVWAPDVYQGSPVPTTAFLAVGSKAAGFVLVLRILFTAAPLVAAHWSNLLIGIAAATILYGNLCAIPQRNLKRLLGYSSIGNAGYLLLGVAAGNIAGGTAVLFYLSGYLFTVLAAFLVICVITRDAEDEDVSVLAGLHQRSPLLAVALTLAMVSLAGIPPLAGFFGKVLLLKSVLEKASTQPAYYALIAITLFGVLVSFYYYLGIVRAIFWSKNVPDYSEIAVSPLMRVGLVACIVGMLYLGIYPNGMINAATQAVQVLKF